MHDLLVLTINKSAGLVYSTLVCSGNILKLFLDWQMVEDLWKSNFIYHTEKKQLFLISKTVI